MKRTLRKFWGLQEEFVSSWRTLEELWSKWEEMGGLWRTLEEFIVRDIVRAREGPTKSSRRCSTPPIELARNFARAEMRKGKELRRT